MLETKTLPFEDVEFKFNDTTHTVEGYASVFNSNDLSNDTVLPGAFKGFIAKTGGRHIMRVEHFPWMHPGIWTKAAEDSKGLHVFGELTPGNSAAEDLRASMKHGTVMGLSIGFPRPDPSTFEKKSGGGRILRELAPFETSFTAVPMEPLATIESFKSELDGVDNIRDMEMFLRDSGMFSKSMATALISHVKGLCRSESEQESAEKMRELQQALQLKAVLDKYDLSKLLA